MKPDSVNYAVELVQLGLDLMTAVAILLDMEKRSTFVFPTTCSLKVASVLAERLKGAVQLLRERQAS